MIVLAAIIAVLAWNTGVRRMGAPNAALFINLVPITALAISMAEGYQPVAAEYIGTALVIFALVGSNLAARSNRHAWARVKGSLFGRTRIAPE